jgi:hypothetical protein
MSAHLQSALRYRLSVPALLLAAVIAAAIAIAAAALLASSDQASPAGASTHTPPLQHDTVCVSPVVGHC